MYGNNMTGRGVSIAAAAAAVGYGASLGEQQTATRQPELMFTIERLQRAIVVAEDTARELASRLEGVLRPAVPEKNESLANQIQPAPPQSGYAGQVYETTGRVEALTDRLQDLLRRLEA